MHRVALGRAPLRVRVHAARAQLPQHPQWTHARVLRGLGMVPHERVDGAATRVWRGPRVFVRDGQVYRPCDVEVDRRGSLLHEQRGGELFSGRDISVGVHDPIGALDPECLPVFPFVSDRWQLERVCRILSDEHRIRGRRLHYRDKPRALARHDDQHLGRDVLSDVQVYVHNTPKCRFDRLGCQRAPSNRMLRHEAHLERGASGVDRGDASTQPVQGLGHGALHKQGATAECVWFLRGVDLSRSVHHLRLGTTDSDTSGATE